MNTSKALPEKPKAAEVSTDPHPYFYLLWALIFLYAMVRWIMYARELGFFALLVALLWLWGVGFMLALMDRALRKKAEQPAPTTTA